MTPPDFIELTGGDDGLPILIARADIALVREAGQTVGNTRTLVILRGSGVIVPVATEFANVVNRIATTSNRTEG